MSFRSARTTVSSLVDSIKRFPSVRSDRRQEALRIKVERREQAKRDEEARKKADEQLIPYVAAWEEVCDIEETARIVKDNLLGRLRDKEEYYEQDAATVENTADKSEECQVFPKAVFTPPENIDSYDILGLAYLQAGNRKKTCVRWDLIRTSLGCFLCLAMTLSVLTLDVPVQY
ncbi:hypothetical protein BDV96DRAFT_653935 [Lophiotrema nucula]|uniref:Uncharacterized protein n=1 Tax=Lophiotrema nucula TaxID=690887 RepID=A0A6A5YK36_9PLEO|nr:hypothetical protein BDV96DRAFT_653935 [Lophiotrema nucula]